MIGKTMQLKSEPQSVKEESNKKKSFSFKRIILLELCILFLASAFPSDKNPGWIQQSVPVNKTINDIFFIDSLRGWAVTDWGSDSISVILNTTNGGTNWLIQYSNYYPYSRLNAIQFVDSQNGYAVGGWGIGSLLKTTNSGLNWISTAPTSAVRYSDIFFVNKDTGWICDYTTLYGGLWKTSNGGQNWTQQLGVSYSPSKLFFINRDTGWCACNDNKLYRTTNSGINWSLQFTSQINIQCLFFLNKEKGWMYGGYNSNAMGIAFTTDGGFNWTNSQGATSGTQIYFANDSIGYSGGLYQRMSKSSDGGKHWYYQISPINANYLATGVKNDTNNAWGGYSGIVHTTDGGGPILQIANNNEQIAKDFVLYQNYPNPFNPATSIKYSVKKSEVRSQKSELKIVVYNLLGKEVKILINEKKSPGEYEILFRGDNLPSGIYFYSLFADGVRVDTKKMLMVK